MAAREEKEEKEEDGEEERNRSRLICSPVKVPRLPRARFPMAVRIGCGSGAPLISSRQSIGGGVIIALLFFDFL